MSTVLTTPAEDFYSSPEWRETRERVKERDGRRCTVARLFGGECSGRLHVHHIEPREERPDLALDEDNLATVCAGHHNTWERLRRELTREPKVPPCRHRHPYRTGRLACLNERRKQVGLPPVDIWAEDAPENGAEAASQGISRAAGARAA